MFNQFEIFIRTFSIIPSSNESTIIKTPSCNDAYGFHPSSSNSRKIIAPSRSSPCQASHMLSYRVSISRVNYAPQILHPTNLCSIFFKSSSCEYTWVHLEFGSNINRTVLEFYPNVNIYGKIPQVL